MRKLTVRVVVGLMVALFLTTTFGSLAHAAATITTYTVQPGDSLWKVANQFNTTVNYLRQLNNYWASYVTAGQVLRVPADNSASGANQSYVVQYGDTLWNISQRFGVSYQAIKDANHLYSNSITIGQTLVIPGSTTTASTPSATQTGIAYSQTDMDMLARIIYAESRGEPYVGQVAVGAVVVNRVKSPSFPNTMREVIYQDLAFESVANGQYTGGLPDSSAYQAAIAALNGQDPTDGALYFYNPAKVTNPNSWVYTRKIVLQIGNHVFCI